MNMIENLYNSICLEDLGFVDSEEYKSASTQVCTYLKKLSLEIKQEVKLSDLITVSQCKAEKQGFEFGFKYAMSLIKECGLK